MRWTLEVEVALELALKRERERILWLNVVGMQTAKEDIVTGGWQCKSSETWSCRLSGISSSVIGSERKR